MEINWPEGVRKFTDARQEMRGMAINDPEIKNWIREQDDLQAGIGSTSYDPIAKRFIVKDSGKRQHFSGGMMRDVQEGKLDIWRVFVGPLVERLAAHLTKGATKYPDVTPGVPNWTLAEGQEEMARFKASAARHFWQWFNCMEDEDHFAATIFNMNGHEYVKGKKDA